MGEPSIDLACPTGDRYTFYVNGEESMKLYAHTAFTRLNGVRGKLKFDVSPAPMSAGGEPLPVTFEIRNTSGYPIAFTNLKDSRGYMLLRESRDLDKDRVYKVTLMPGEEYDYLPATDQQIREDRGDLQAQSFVASLKVGGAWVNYSSVDMLGNYDGNATGASDPYSAAVSYQDIYDEYYLKLNNHDNFQLKLYFEAREDGGFWVRLADDQSRYLGLTKLGYTYMFQDVGRRDSVFLKNEKGKTFSLYDEADGTKVYVELDGKELTSYYKKNVGDYWWSWITRDGDERVLFSLNILSRGKNPYK